MHPALLGQVAQDHVRSLIHEADAARLAQAAAPRPGLRRRVGLRLIATGEWLTCDCTHDVPTVATRRG